MTQAVVMRKRRDWMAAPAITSRQRQSSQSESVKVAICDGRNGEHRYIRTRAVDSLYYSYR